MGGKFAAGTASSPGRVQQRIRQYTGLANPAMRLDLARRLVAAKIETQRRYVLRASREEVADRAWCRPRLDQIRGVLADVPKAGSAATLLGLEGTAARAYFDCLRVLIASGLPEDLRPDGRNRRPPRDRFNCLLSFGYALLQSLVHRTLLAVGLEPALGFYHQPRTAAPPLVLDVMELFRTLLWDIPLIGSLNRGQWEPAGDFSVTPGQVWLSDAGRRKAIELFEQRLTESYQHPHTGQSLSYAADRRVGGPTAGKGVDGLPRTFRPLAVEVEYGVQTMASGELRCPRSEALAAGGQIVGILRLPAAIQRFSLPARRGNAGATALATVPNHGRCR